MVLPILFFFVGALIGSIINLCIYRFGIEKTDLSPWFRLFSSSSSNPKPNVYELIPIIGWWFRLNKAGQSIVRPALIELVWSVGLPLFFVWHRLGGLTDNIPPSANWQAIWFGGQTVLFALMFIATFIDFDQRIIPDWITIPGTWFAVLYNSIFPSFGLPEIVPGLTGPAIESIHFGDGPPGAIPPAWFASSFGCSISVIIFWSGRSRYCPNFPCWN